MHEQPFSLEIECVSEYDIVCLENNKPKLNETLEGDIRNRDHGPMAGKKQRSCTCSI